MTSTFDLATPGTGPMRITSALNHSIEDLKYKTYNISLRSKSDLNLNPNPEGVVKIVAPELPITREGIYAIQTDRGDLSATIETQINVKGNQQFKNRLQDYLKPTTKETTLYAYDGNIAPITSKQSQYSQYLPEYLKIEGKELRISGTQNYSLKSATEHSYIPGAATTGLNNNVVQDPNAVINNLWKRPDYNVDGAGTFAGAKPDKSKFQNYTSIATPTTNGMRLDYNVETDGDNYSLLLNNNVKGIENRQVASYQIAPLMNNPLHKIWNPEDKGEIPAFYCDSNPSDFSYMELKHLPDNEWSPDAFKKGGQSANAYILGMEEGVHNKHIEWRQGFNNKPGIVYDSHTTPGSCYSGNRSVKDLYSTIGSDEYNRALQHVDNTYTTLGDPSAGFIKG